MSIATSKFNSVAAPLLNTHTLDLFYYRNILCIYMYIITMHNINVNMEGFNLLG